MIRYRIGFFTVDWNYELVESTLQGLSDFVKDNADVQICIFDCFGKDQGDEKDDNEYAIFSLPDLRTFDGVIIQASQVVLEKARLRLSERIIEAGIPAVTIDCPVPGCQFIGIDNRQAQYDVTAHLIAKHGVRTMLYIAGLENNGCPEAADRLQGFLDACRDYQIPEENYSVFHGTWRTEDGNTAMRAWFEERRFLPDAVVSGNDEMALGAIEVLHEKGYVIPEDLIVTGFDYVASAQMIRPTLTSVRRDYSKLTRWAMNTLFDMLKGKVFTDGVRFPYELILTESCGCQRHNRQEDYRPRYYAQTRFLKNFHTMQEKMAEKLFGAENIQSLMDAIEETISIFGCENVYLCLNEDCFRQDDMENTAQGRVFFSETVALADCTKDNMTAEAGHIYERFACKKLLPDRIMQEERLLFFYPLHYNQRSLGYLAMNSLSKAAKFNLHENVLSYLEVAIENVRQKMMLQHLNGKLDELYIQDALTGLYNRFGYERYAEEVYERIMSKTGTVQVAFIDMDDMKQINDNFGHKAGDEAIRTVSCLLSSVLGMDDFLMRYGGDEFLLITSGEDTDLTDRIEASSHAYQEKLGLPYSLSVSTGSCIASREEPLTLEECVKRADIAMYEVKERRHRRK